AIDAVARARLDRGVGDELARWLAEHDDGRVLGLVEAALEIAVVALRERRAARVLDVHAVQLVLRERSGAEVDADPIAGRRRCFRGREGDVLRDERAGRHAARVVHQDAAALAHPYRRAVLDGERRDRRIRGRTADAHVVAVALRVADAERNTDGVPRGVL